MDDSTYFHTLYVVAGALLLFLGGRSIFFWWRERSSQPVADPSLSRQALILIGFALSLSCWTFSILPWEMIAYGLEQYKGPSEQLGGWRHTVLWFIYPAGTVLAWIFWIKAWRTLKHRGLTEKEKQSAIGAVVLTSWFWAMLATLPLFIRLPAASLVFVPVVNEIRFP